MDSTKAKNMKLLFRISQLELPNIENKKHQNNSVFLSARTKKLKSFYLVFSTNSNNHAMWCWRPGVKGHC